MKTRCAAGSFEEVALIAPLGWRSDMLCPSAPPRKANAEAILAK